MPAVRESRTTHLGENKLAVHLVRGTAYTDGNERYMLN